MTFINIQRVKDLINKNARRSDNYVCETQKFHLQNLFTTQERLLYLGGTNYQIRSPSKKQLQRAKQFLCSRLINEEEINSLCQFQSEITKLETKLKELEKKGNYKQDKKFL